MKQKKSYAEQVSETFSSFSENCTSKKNYQNLCLTEIAIALWAIVDTLEGRNVELKDGKTAQDTMQNDIQ